MKRHCFMILSGLAIHPTDAQTVHIRIYKGLKKITGDEAPRCTTVSRACLYGGVHMLCGKNTKVSYIKYDHHFDKSLAWKFDTAWHTVIK